MNFTLENVKENLPLAVIIIIVVIVLIKLYKQVSRPRVYLIYANWCGACENFKPTWNSLKAEFGDKLAEIDADDKKTLESFKSKHKVEIPGYPTIIAVGSKTEMFKQSRTHENLRKWIGNHT